MGVSGGAAWLFDMLSRVSNGAKRKSKPARWDAKVGDQRKAKSATQPHSLPSLERV
jgi:hypothetical protein